jgi:hypothetical protein
MDDRIIEKVLSLRKIYSEIYKNKDSLSPEKFELITDKVINEIDSFRKLTNIHIDIRLITSSEEDYDKYLSSGAASEFITRGDGIL